MKIYIAGRITGYPEYKKRFDEAVSKLEAKGHVCMSPAILPGGFTQADYMRICLAMIDVCECIYFLDNWLDSEGARIEHDYAQKVGKLVLYQSIEEYMPTK
jgi:hypothetical protein